MISVCMPVCPFVFYLKEYNLIDLEFIFAFEFYDSMFRIENVAYRPSLGIFCVQRHTKEFQ